MFKATRTIRFVRQCITNVVVCPMFLEPSGNLKSNALKEKLPFLHVNKSHFLTFRVFWWCYKNSKTRKRMIFTVQYPNLLWKLIFFFRMCLKIRLISPQLDQICNFLTKNEMGLPSGIFIFFFRSAASAIANNFFDTLFIIQLINRIIFFVVA